jgi:uroporphyrinogen-III decarboxylase
MMTSKERVRAVLEGRLPDRVPMNEFLYSKQLYNHVLGYKPDYYNAEDVMKCARLLGLDMGVLPIGGFSGIGNSVEQSETYHDEWNILYHKPEEASWPSGVPIGFPLHGREDWEQYDFPNIDAPGRLKEIETAVRLGHEYSMGVFGSIRGPFTATWLLFGFDQFSMLLYDDPDLLDEVIAKVTDFFISAGRMLAGAGVDAVLFADDYGGSGGPMISPMHFTHHVLPQLSRLVGAIKETGVPVMMHSDGDIRTLLPDIMRHTAINGCHPMERNAHMDIAEIKRLYGHNHVLMGNVNNQGVLINGSVDDVVAQTKECLRLAGPGGGYILGSDHSVHDDMPIVNILAMIETGRKYGAYPLDMQALQP